MTPSTRPIQQVRSTVFYWKFVEAVRDSLVVYAKKVYENFFYLQILPRLSLALEMQSLELKKDSIWNTYVRMQKETGKHCPWRDCKMETRKSEMGNYHSCLLHEMDRCMKFGYQSDSKALRSRNRSTRLSYRGDGVRFEDESNVTLA